MKRLRIPLRLERTATDKMLFRLTFGCAQSLTLNNPRPCLRPRPKPAPRSNTSKT
jgi:hypothetical protein